MKIWYLSMIKKLIRVSCEDHFYLPYRNYYCRKYSEISQKLISELTAWCRRSWRWLGPCTRWLDSVRSKIPNYSEKTSSWQSQKKKRQTFDYLLKSYTTKIEQTFKCLFIIVNVTHVMRFRFQLNLCNTILMKCNEGKLHAMNPSQWRYCKKIVSLNIFVMLEMFCNVFEINCYSFAMFF